jgi:uracil-DNA glycosylase
VEAGGAAFLAAMTNVEPNVGPVDRNAAALDALAAEIVACRACPRLVEWREQVARDKRAAFRDEHYWGRPVPGFGDPQATVLVLGLAPAAHGANRTGRVFTGDRSGDFLFASMHRTGFASQPTSTHCGDGLRLTGAWISAAVRCAPPANAPTPAERDACRPFLVRELALLDRLRVVVCLGAFGYEAACAVLGVRPRPRFAHGLVTGAPGGLTLVCSFHPSQQNTFTRRLTPQMLDDVLLAARRISGQG